jgi:hypothetical protein
MHFETKGNGKVLTIWKKGTLNHLRRTNDAWLQHAAI